MVDQAIREEEVNQILDTLVDPEIPVVTIREMGILRDVSFDGANWRIIITPTYSGCPAMHMIEVQIKLALAQIGVENYIVETQLSPAWTTDWMTEHAKEKLEDYGIAPPNPDRINRPVRCPQCKSTEVKELSTFGSTSCKSLWQCTSCLEPFDYFKCH